MGLIDSAFVKTMVAAAAGTILAAYVSKKLNLG